MRKNDYPVKRGYEWSFLLVSNPEEMMIITNKQPQIKDLCILYSSYCQQIPWKDHNQQSVSQHFGPFMSPDV